MTLVQTASPTHPAEGTRTFGILFALWLTVFSVSSQTMIIAPLLPRIAEQLGVAESALGMLVTGYAVAVGVVAVIAGPISDKLGRRWMLLWGTAWMALALALHGAAGSYAALLGARVLAGAGGGVLTGAAAAYVGDHFPPERRGWANGWIMSGFAVGQIVAIPLGTLLAARFGFQVPFLLFAASMALSSGLIGWLLPQPPVRRVRGKLSIRQSVKHYRELLRTPGGVPAIVAFFLIFLGNSLYLLFFPAWLEAARGATVAQVAGVFGVGGVATVLAGPLAGSWSDRIGRKRMVVAASVGAVGIMLATPWIVGAVWVAYLVFFVLMALVAARATPLQALLTEIVPEERRGSLMSLAMAVGQVGAGLGGALAGVVYAALGYASTATLGALSVLLMAGIVARWIAEPPHGDPD